MTPQQNNFKTSLNRIGSTNAVCLRRLTVNSSSPFPFPRLFHIFFTIISCFSSPIPTATPDSNRVYDLGEFDAARYMLSLSVAWSEDDECVELIQTNKTKWHASERLVEFKEKTKWVWSMSSLIIIAFIYLVLGLWIYIQVIFCWNVGLVLVFSRNQRLPFFTTKKDFKFLFGFLATWCWVFSICPGSQ